MGTAAVLLAIVAATLPTSASACRCARGDDAAHVAATPVIFTGRARPGPPDRDGRALVYQFDVLEVWKGDLPAVLSVRTNRSSATCGASFEPGGTYAVFAAPFRGDMVETGLCQLAPFQSRPERLTALMAAYRTQVREFDEAMDAATDASTVLRRKLTFLFAHDDWSAAVLALDALLALSPPDAAALLAERGVANFRLVRLEAARRDFMSALRSEPKSPRAERGMAALARLAPIPAPARHDAQRAWPEVFDRPEQR